MFIVLKSEHSPRRTYKTRAGLKRHLSLCAETLRPGTTATVTVLVDHWPNPEHEHRIRLYREENDIAWGWSTEEGV